MAPSLNTHLRQARRTLLGASALNGASVALGMLLVAGLVHALLGSHAATNASVGAIVALIPDMPRPRRGKLAHLVAAPLLGVPLFLAVQLLRGHPLELGLLLVPGTFLAFLSTAWGRRGMPVAAALMFAMLLAMAPAPAADAHEAMLRTAWCALGAVLYVLYGTASNTLLNGRYRTQALAELLLSVAALLRLHAQRIERPLDDPGSGTEDPRPLGEVLRRQAALAEQMQAARDLVLEAPGTPRRQLLAGMLVVVLEMRDRLIVGELDLERAHASQSASLQQLAKILELMAQDVEQVADALLLRRTPSAAHDHRDRLEALRAQAQDAVQHADAPDDDALEQAALLRSISVRIGDQDAAVRQLAALARGEEAPDLSAVRSGWQLFVSPAYWSLQPLLGLWHWRQPALRHALRAALAIGAGYGLAMALPWGSRDYWILLTIVVVLRGSLAQTLERRNQRVLGTLVGSLLAVGLLMLEPPPVLLLLVVIVAQGVAHAFVVRRYTITAVAGSVLGLLLAHLLYAASHPAFDFVERVGDTLLGTAIAWGFSYVLPSWERDQIAATVRRVCRAMAQHARHSLALAKLAEVTGQPELAWRLARREAYDALSALVQATGRALVEPRAVRPPLATLEQLQGHGYQLLGQLSAIQSILLLRRQRLQLEAIAEPLAAAGQQIARALDLGQPWTGAAAAATAATEPALPAVPEHLPDPLAPDSGPWLLRRLSLAACLACRLREDAERVLRERSPARPDTGVPATGAVPAAPPDPASEPGFSSAPAAPPAPQ
ncbi:MAG TPA: FUSC family membrane protein [Ottowia sp.]|uniref:FUSC family protein n=1 Tax=Ottowia sp. TaxID=1898956 RepID=UPI002D1C8362|nr:FUSC family membrane protein [Ottowia sp.]HMN20753.1 FUSC family membrane protein [Ottowia sp.]